MIPYFHISEGQLNWYLTENANKRSNGYPTQQKLLPPFHGKLLWRQQMKFCSFISRLVQFWFLSEMALNPEHNTWSLTRLVTHMAGHSHAWSLTHLVTHTPGHSYAWSVTRQVTHMPGHSHAWSLTRLVTHTPGHSHAWSLTRLVTHTPGHSHA